MRVRRGWPRSTAREHRVTRRAPVEMLVEEQQRLHRLPEAPYTAVFGETRRVSRSATVSFGAVTYSVPHTLADETVWVRIDGDRVVVTHCAPSGPVEVAPPPAFDTWASDDRRRPLPATPPWAARPAPEADERGRGGVLGVGRGRPAVAGRGRLGGHVTDQGQDVPSRRPGPPPRPDPR